jgi:hypothetical protein
MTTRPAEELTLHDRLSHLTYAQACRLLGPRAKELLRAGGALVGAAFSFLGELLPAGEPTSEATYLGDLFRKQLTDCLEEDETGRPTLTVKLPDRSSLDALASALGRLLAQHGLARSAPG